MTDHDEALFAAVERENDKTPEQRMQEIRAAIEAGADIGARRDYGFTALHDAVSAPYRRSLPPADLDVVRLLIELGADVNAENEIGVRPLNSAIALNHTDAPEAIEASKRVIELLCEHGAEPGPKAPLSHYTGADLALYKRLLAFGAIDEPDGEGRTPLHMAASSFRPDSVKLLLEHGADIDACDNKKKTPLQLARKRKGNTPKERKQRDEIIEMIVAHSKQASD